MKYIVDVPVELGQTVWKLGNFDRITETTVDAIVIRKTGVFIKLACNTTYETSLKTLGKTWWLTLEDAVNYVEFKNKKLKNTRS
jgi:hypothetical protein